MAVKLSREDLVRENTRLKTQLAACKSSKMASNLASVFKTLIKFGTICGCIAYSVTFLAGRTTKVDAAIEVGASLADAVKELAPAWWLQILTLAVGALLIRSNGRYRNTNRQLVEKVSLATKQKETLRDPGRSSSGLGTDGETHQRDRT